MGWENETPTPLITSSPRVNLGKPMFFRVKPTIGSGRLFSWGIRKDKASASNPTGLDLRVPFQCLFEEVIEAHGVFLGEAEAPGITSKNIKKRFSSWSLL